MKRHLILTALMLSACTSAATSDAQSVYRIDRLRDILDQDVRILSAGDSFAVANTRNIVPQMLNTWPIEQIAAIQTGAAIWSPLIGYEAHVDWERVDATGGFEILRSTPGSEFFALPVRSIREMYGPLEGPLFTITNKRLDGDLRWWPTLWSASTGQIESGVPTDGSALIVNNDVPEDEYFHLAGSVVTRIDNGKRVPGLYFSALADNSWSYSGFGADLSAQHATHKVFTQEQIANWFTATTIDADQPLLVLYNFDTGNSSVETVIARIEQMIDQTQSAAEDAGIANVWHCVIIPHMHRIGNLTEAQIHSAFQRYEQAAMTVAASRDNVGVFSLYSALDRVYFDGRDEACQWLTDNGWGEITWNDQTINLIDTYGADLLDDTNLHVWNADSGAFFALFMLDVLEQYVRGDYNDDGIVNVSDLLVVINRWGQPFDVDDLLDVIEHWGQTSQGSPRSAVTRNGDSIRSSRGRGTRR